MEVQQTKSFRYTGLVIVLVDFLMRWLEVVSGVGSGVGIIRVAGGVCVEMVG